MLLHGFDVGPDVAIGEDDVVNALGEGSYADLGLYWSQRMQESRLL